MNIVSLLPSATEIVCALGMGDKLVGVSHCCDRPPSVRHLPKMTRTHVPYRADSRTIDDHVRRHLAGHAALYDLDIEALAAVKPDVVVSQALCDVCAVATGEVDDAIRALPGRPALIDLTPNTLDDVFADIETVANGLNVGSAGAALVRSLRERRDRVVSRTNTIAEDERPKVAFLEWLIPPFNGGHWNPELVALAGGRDLLGSRADPSSTLNWKTVVEARPDVVFVACCGFTVERAMQDVDIVRTEASWNALPAVKQGRVYVADGNAYFASPGPRLIDGLEILAHSLHPGVHERPPHYDCRVVSATQ